MLKIVVFKMLPLLAMLPLAGCPPTGLQTPTTAPASSPEVCLAWKRITYAYPGDTPETIVQIRAANAARKAYGCKS